MTDEEYLGCDDILIFLEETDRRASCGLPHVFDGVNNVDVWIDDCPF